MELGLSLGDTTSKTVNGFIGKASDRLTETVAAARTAAAASTAAGSSLGFCMALGIIPSENLADDHDSDDDEGQQILKKNGKVREIIDSSQKVSSLNTPVQLDLLPLVPVLRQTPLTWSSDNGSTERGSSENTPAGRGFEVNRRQAVAGTEEATSSFRHDFGRIGNIIVGGNKREFEIENENDAVEVERGSSRASDEDDNGVSRKKLRLSKEQSAYLEESFKEHNTLNPQKQKVALAKQLNLRPRQVEVWFQNRRARRKLKQTEVDCEYLKRCRETLSEENRRLQKELQELRALKTSSTPFYTQLPATALTMCPSCERVATTAPPPPPPSAASTMASSKPTAPFPLSPKPRSFFPFSHAPPCNDP